MTRMTVEVDQEDQVDRGGGRDQEGVRQRICPISIHWHVTSAGCVAIWPVIVPTPSTQSHTLSGSTFWLHSTRLVSNPGDQAQRKDKVGTFGSAD